MTVSESSSNSSLPGAATSASSSLFAAFDEWRRRCALALCSLGASHQLKTFAWKRFDIFCRRYAPFVPAANAEAGHPLTPPPADCWHLFETRLAVDRTRAGKRYKDWLFEAARAAPGAMLPRLTGGATLLMRDVVRAWLAHEAPRPHTNSLQAPAGGGAPDEAPSLEELLPVDITPADEAAEREWERISVEEARRSWRRLSRRDRVILTARALDLSLADEPVVTAAAARKSMLYAAFHSLLARLADDLRRRYADEESAAICSLARRVLQKMECRALTWARSEKSCAILFSSSERRGLCREKRI